MEETKQATSTISFEEASEKINLIISVFKDIMTDMNKKHNELVSTMDNPKIYYVDNNEVLNYCCNEHDILVIYELGNAIKQIPPYNNLSFTHIYFILIYLIYKLRTEPLFHRMGNGAIFKNFLSRGTDGQEILRISRKLYTDLFMHDLMYGDRNLSSEVRKYFTEMAGGFKKHNTRRYRKRTLFKKHKTNKKNKTNRKNKRKKIKN